MTDWITLRPTKAEVDERLAEVYRVAHPANAALHPRLETLRILAFEIEALRVLERGYRRTKHLWQRRKKLLLEQMRNRRADFVQREMERSDAIQFGAAVFAARWRMDDECKCVACECLRGLIPVNRGKAFLEALPNMVGNAGRNALGRAWPWGRP